ncbi:hypothetical protein HI914_02872 [Erysiphe necator]|nr:hypothetical protein HI914_02872 [Erysiphe necator]
MRRNYTTRNSLILVPEGIQQKIQTVYTNNPSISGTIEANIYDKLVERPGTSCGKDESPTKRQSRMLLRNCGQCRLRIRLS